ncbi:response regulator transcription factor [Murimonas intestini]|uniref:Stage 0 sporulation protein A homolog n=1 Tax=Murimonas intestini TaxID=1337051 RepID=A0AB73T060_9FIRM|nr:response regulator transcription factor [Murimonas intestini]MCR1842289.1 response regulator transcription factor [Murimonas intestini]MCR1867788.1 response regulator transcription factor [Murimonas intestini]MCR1886222.1 response regulator transcription factor [Murimonas intestini]
MNRRIYLVEDEIHLSRILQLYLEKEGYEVTTFQSGMEALKYTEQMPDMWVLDIMLPDISGYDILKQIRLISWDIPVIFMSARNEEMDRVVGLELGSDDYLPKPFLPRELVLRVNKLMQHVYGANDAPDDDSIIINGYKISRNQRTVFLNGEQVVLTNNEFELLIYFVSNKNLVLTRDQILDGVWGTDYYGSDRVVDDTIRRLRKKMDALLLETHYGYGYRLAVQP